MAQLQVSQGDGQERTVELGTAVVSFGRADDMDVVLTEQKASRRHCTFRPVRGGWRVVDEQSSNGTWLGGKPVLSARLQPGDEIEIGETVITYEAEKPAQPLAPRVRRPRQIKPPWGALVAAGFFAVVCWIGAGALSSDKQAAETRAWNRVATAGVAKADRERDEAAWRSSIAALTRQLVQEERASDALKIARAAEARGLPPVPETVTRKSGWQQALEQIEASRVRTSASERRARYRELMTRWFGDAPAIAAIAAAVQADANAARSSGSTEAAQLLADADQAVQDGAFGRAVGDWVEWIAKSPDVTAAEERAVAAKLAGAREQAKAAAAAALAAWDENMKEGRLAAADSAVDAALDRLRGTGYDAWLAARTRRSAGSPGSGAPVPGGGPSAGGSRESDAARAKRVAAEKLDRATRAANALVAKRKFADAAATLTEAATDLTDETVRTTLTLRAGDLAAEAQVLAHVLAAVKADPSPFGTVSVPGGSAKVAGADDAALLVGDAKAGSPRAVPLESLPADAYLVLLDRAKLEEASFVPAALLAFDLGETNAFNLWMRKALAVDALRLDASAVYSRVAKVRMPAEGFVPHPTDGRSVITWTEKLRIENASKIEERAAQLAKVVEKIETSKQAKQVAAVAAAYAKLEAARTHALELIFDEVKYFYPYRTRMREYQPVQMEVDERVKAVREIWEDKTSAKVRPDAALTKLLEQADEMITDIAFMGGDPTPLGDRVERVRMYVGKDLTVRSYFETPADLRLLEYNAEMMAANSKAKMDVSSPERDQVRITNEYRILMGHRRVLRIHEKLVAAARGHSDDMSRIGFFDHFSPVEGKKTPADRMLLAGYPNQPCSENIAAGRGDAQGAFDGWFHSSGHHRNMLMPGWSELGSGQSGRYWTQNFGYAAGDDAVGGGGPQGEPATGE